MKDNKQVKSFEEYLMDAMNDPLVKMISSAINDKRRGLQRPSSDISDLFSMLNKNGNTQKSEQEQSIEEMFANLFKQPESDEIIPDESDEEVTWPKEPVKEDKNEEYEKDMHLREFGLVLYGLKVGDAFTRESWKDKNKVIVLLDDKHTFEPSDLIKNMIYNHKSLSGNSVIVHPLKNRLFLYDTRTFTLSLYSLTESDIFGEDWIKVVIGKEK